VLLAGGKVPVGGRPALPCPPSGPQATLVKGEDSRSRISVWMLNRASVTLESTPMNEQTGQWDLQEKDGHAEELLVRNTDRWVHQDCEEPR